MPMVVITTSIMDVNNNRATAVIQERTSLGSF